MLGLIRSKSKSASSSIVQVQPSNVQIMNSSQDQEQSLERVKQSVEELVQYVEPFQSLHAEQNRSGPIQLAIEQATKSFVAPREPLALGQLDIGHTIVSDAK